MQVELLENARLLSYIFIQLNRNKKLLTVEQFTVIIKVTNLRVLGGSL